MKPTIRRLMQFFLLAGLLVILPSVLNAEQFKGNFVLTSDTYWADTLLPAGEYQFSLDTAANIITLDDGNRSIRRLVAYTESVDSPVKSQLLIVHDSDKAMAHILYLDFLKTAFHFRVPQPYEVTTRIMTQNSTPAPVEHIRVNVNGQ